MDRSRSEPWRSLLLVLSAVTITAAVLMHFSNRHVNRYPAELDGFHTAALIVIFSFWILILGVYLRIRLKPCMDKRGSSGIAADQTALWELFTLLPPQLFRLAVVLGISATAGFKWSEHLYMRMIGFNLPENSAWLWLIKGFALNLSTTFLLAAIYYGLSRLILRPYVLQLQKIDVSRVAFRSLSGPLIFTFVIVLAMVIIRIVWYVLNSQIQEEPITWNVLLSISLIGLAGGLLLFFLIAYGYRRQVMTMEARIEELIREGKAGTPRKVPLASSDETGELAAALNDLQDRLSRDYAELEEELQLARKVRSKLFPGPKAQCGSLDISFRELAADHPGGEFYDLAETDDRHLVAIAGRVPDQGAAAVLMVSALLALFRAEAGRGSSAASILNRLMAAWSESFPGLGKLTAGLVVMDRTNSSVAVALAGNAAALWIPAGGFGGMPVLESAGETAEMGKWRQLSPGESLKIGPAPGTRAASSRNEEERGQHEAWLQITRR